MDSVQLPLKMVTSMKEIFITDYYMEWANLHGKMALYMKDNLHPIESLGKEHMFGLMVPTMKELFRMD